MISSKIWLHGRTVYFEQWVLPSSVQTHNRGLESHSAIFFTTGKDYALKAARGSGGLCSASLIESANILDMNNCTAEASEQYRLQVAKKPIGCKNPQVINSLQWSQAWATGSIMKYSATSPPLSTEEYAQLTEKARLAVYGRHTPEGVAAYHELQQLTRRVIDELILSARELGYDAVIGNEIDTQNPAQPTKFEILFVLNETVLTPPNWLSKPKNITV